MCPKVDNAENSILFSCSSSSNAYAGGTTGSWIIGSNVNGGDSNAFSIWNPNTASKQIKLNNDGSTYLGITNGEVILNASSNYTLNTNSVNSFLQFRGTPQQRIIT